MSPTPTATALPLLISQLHTVGWFKKTTKKFQNQEMFDIFQKQKGA